MPSNLLRKVTVLTVFTLGNLALSQGAFAGEESPLYFWTVQSPTGTVHLLGSLHVGTGDMYPLDGAIEEAFEDSTVLVVEVDLNDQAQARMQELVLEKGVYTDGTTLRQNLSGETFELFKEYLDERGLPQMTFYPMKPWLVALTLTVLEVGRLGYDPALGIDQHFLKRAREAGKQIQELESVDSQINLLSGFSRELQELFLVYTLLDNQNSQQKVGTIFEAWKNGDPQSIDSLMKADLEEDPRLRSVYEKLFDERNLEMAARIRDLLRTEKTSFVVIGAAHLAGERGIVRLLKQQGSSGTTIRQRQRGSAGTARTTVSESAAAVH